MRGPEATVRYRTGCLSFLTVLIFPVVILLAVAAFRPSLVDHLSQARRGGWIAWTKELAIGDFNIPVAVIAVWIFYELWRMILRLRDPRMIVSDDRSIHFHPTERRKPVRWEDIREIRHDDSALKSDLYFVLDERPGFRLRNCDEYEAEKFVEAAMGNHRSAEPSPN